MKQVLIVDDESRMLRTIVAGLKSYEEQFSVLTAENGREAVGILAAKQVDLVVTDLRMPEMDGFELLAYLSGNHPFIPSIVMTAFSTPEIEQRVNSSGSQKLLEKPLDFQRLAEAILDGLNQEGKEGSVAGFSLSNFLQLLNMEQKTCLLKVQSDRAEGFLYLQEGEIIAALSGTLKGEEALFQLLISDQVHITFQKLPKKKVARMIEKPLMALLIDGMSYRDEQVQQSPPSGDEPAPADGVEIEVERITDPPSFKLSGEDSSDTSGKKPIGGIPMADVNATLQEVMKIDGAIAAALVDWKSGMTLGTIGSNFDIDMAAAGNTNVVKAKLTVMKDLKLKGGIEDILITITEQYHLIRMLHGNANLFLYVTLDREKANLGMARHKLSTLEEKLEV